MGNHLKTFLLMVGLTVLFIVLGEAIAGEEGLYIAFFIALALNFSAYWFSDKIAIAMTRSRPLKESEAPEIYQMVQKLSQKANLPMPRLYIMPTNQPNAFATGRNPQNAVISVTEGLIRLLNKEEIEGVLAHELAHIKNRDILIGSIAAVMAGALTVLARMGMWGAILGGGRRRSEGGGALIQLLALVLAPIAALLIRMAISRAREYQADSTAADITGNPGGLANALRKLQQTAQRQPYQVNEAAAHMFIINPLSGSKASSMANLFSTHPPIETRVKRLLES